MKELLIGLLTLTSFSVAAQSPLKVGSKAIHVGTFGGVKVKIIAVRLDSNYVAKYKDTVYRNVKRSELAVLKGCSEDLCVKDKAIHLGTFGNVEVRIIGIRADGNYVAKFRDSIYKNVRRSELGKL